MRFLREPLVHFLAIGGVLFAVYAMLQTDSPTENNLIIITANDVAILQAQWTKRWRRAPKSDDIEKLLEAYVREEVLYREALARGLDRNDLVIRRRLVRKLEFLITDTGIPKEPTRAELRAFYEANKVTYNQEKYRMPTRVSFMHVYFNPDLRGQSTEKDARALLAKFLDGSQFSDQIRYGDPFALDDDYVEKSEAEVARDFGRAFAERLFKAEPGRWSGPIASRYGLHLVLVHERTKPRLPDFAQIRNEVARDYLNSKRQANNAEAYARLRGRYKVIVEATTDPRAGQ